MFAALYIPRGVVLGGVCHCYTEVWTLLWAGGQLPISDCKWQWELLSSSFDLPFPISELLVFSVLFKLAVGIELAY